MSETNPCPRCGAPLPAATPPESCPRCLLAAGLESVDPGASSPVAGAPPRPAPTAPSPEEIGRHFPQLELLELLGQGGMGIVYKARQRTLDRLVALKVLPPDAAREAGFAERFTREGRTLARLQHPNIVGVHDFGVADGLYYLVMEYVDGANLRDAMHDGHLTSSQALAIVPQICDALQYAHEQGVVHRDIKPENILIDRTGRVRIADFGLAKIVQRTPVDVTLTRAGQVMGTLHYMAPEQYRTPDVVDHRADIYSLGVVFYEMLTGELPLGSFPPPSDKPGVDARIDGVVMRALERERDRRWQHASELKTRVSQIVAGPDAPLPPEAAPVLTTDAAHVARTGADAVGAPTAEAHVAPPSRARLSRLAVAGGLAVPVTIALGGLFSVVDLRGMGVGALLVALVLAGFIASLAAYVQIQRSSGALTGKAWTVAGMILGPAYLCCGIPLFMSVGVPFGISVKEGPDGTHVRMPFLDVEEKDGRTRVRMPGIDVEESDEGTHVRVPGVTVKESGGNVRVRVEGIAVTDADRAAAKHVTGGPSTLTDDDRASLAATARRLWQYAGPRANWAGKLKLDATAAESFRLFHVALGETGRAGRVVVTDGRRTLSIPFAVDDEGMVSLTADETVELTFQAATDADRDGHLGD